LTCSIGEGHIEEWRVGGRQNVIASGLYVIGADWLKKEFDSVEGVL
jgi:hypothetical protein